MEAVLLLLILLVIPSLRITDSRISFRKKIPLTHVLHVPLVEKLLDKHCCQQELVFEPDPDEASCDECDHDSDSEFGYGTDYWQKGKKP